jgi:hypothetical protein
VPTVDGALVDEVNSSPDLFCNCVAAIIARFLFYSEEDDPGYFGVVAEEGRGFPGSAFFTRDEPVAQHWAQIYRDGYIETRVPAPFFNENLLQYEWPYPGWEGMAELEIPPDLLGPVSSFPRSKY